MASTVDYDSVEVGSEIPGALYSVRRDGLVKYCGASGDFNVIHWNERIATAVGLPSVIAHGMFTMAEAGRVVTDWLGDPGAVLSFRTRFSRPVVVPDDDTGALLAVGGVVEEKLEGGRVVVGLSATVDGSNVLAAARVTVQLSVTDGPPAQAAGPAG